MIERACLLVIKYHSATYIAIVSKIVVPIGEFGDMTSSGETGLKIRTHANPKFIQVSGGENCSLFYSATRGNCSLETSQNLAMRSNR